MAVRRDGAKRDRIAIKRDAADASSLVEELETVTGLANIAADILPGDARENENNVQTEASADYTIIVDQYTATKAITPQMKVVVVGGRFKDRVFSILGCPVRRERSSRPEIWLRCSEDLS
jgi:head-tail adaptor